MSYVVLMQRTWHEVAKYQDVEGVIYHYPRLYFNAITGYERFVYYRPSHGARPDERSTYIGFGTLGEPFPDPHNAERRFVGVRQYRKFPRPVPFSDAEGNYFESRYSSRTAFTGKSVRAVSPVDYFRILAHAGVRGDPFMEMEDVERVSSSGFSPFHRTRPPTEPLREISEIPEGTGYRPSGRAIDIFESAALQERARADHQKTLRLLHDLVRSRGGRALLNNNIDLYARLGSRSLLIEAKSLGSASAAVDRMRYGIGQLVDYDLRYRSELGSSEPVLAFGAIPDKETSWIGSILEDAKVAFVALDRGAERIVPLNARAQNLPIFES